jgi:hypothetical protein
LRAVINSKEFVSDLKNIIDYSIGFLDGVQSGKREFLNGLGTTIAEMAEEFVDASARLNPQQLHHVYEWYQSGSPKARLYDITYTVSNLGLSFKSALKQSSSIQDGSKTPFYNKAYIMENGIPVTITPKANGVLVFDDNGETVFTKAPVTIDNPGGTYVQGQFEEVFDEFFGKYFTQAFLRSSGVKQYLENPKVFKTNMSAARRGGKSLGTETGYKWIVNGGMA